MQVSQGWILLAEQSSQYASHDSQENALDVITNGMTSNATTNKGESAYSLLPTLSVKTPTRSVSLSVYPKSTHPTTPFSIQTCDGAPGMPQSW